MPSRTRTRAPGTPGRGERARATALEALDRLEREMPEARIALVHGSEVELLVSVILSTQCTDARVNLVTPALFARFPGPTSFARAEPEELWPYIQSCGLYRTKARNIVAAMQAIESLHGGRVPRTREALESLPGVGRKTAGVVLIHLGEGQHFPVDTHVGRLARRLGFARATDPSGVERELMALLPPGRWNRGHQLLVWHGRRTCSARSPACPRCVLRDLCPRRGVARVTPGRRGPGEAKRSRGGAQPRSTARSRAGRPSSPRRRGRRPARP